MFIQNRVHNIERLIAHLAQNVLVLRLTSETLRLSIWLNDGTTLRVAERWANGVLTRYSYYWLDTHNTIKVGWDNVPHHPHLSNFPHHKHRVFGKAKFVRPFVEGRNTRQDGSDLLGFLEPDRSKALLFIGSCFQIAVK